MKTEGKSELFDAEVFSESIKRSLIAGIPSARLDAMLRQMVLEIEGISFSRLCLIVAQTCLVMGRRKQVRQWLEQLLKEVADEDLLAAIAVAVGSSQAELVVDLYQKLLKSKVLPAAKESLAVAEATIALALRLRLPMRGEAWGLHCKLLKAAGQLMVGVMPALDTDEKRVQAWSCLAQIYRLRGLAQSQVDQALAEAARYGRDDSTSP